MIKKYIFGYLKKSDKWRRRVEDRPTSAFDREKVDPSTITVRLTKLLS